MLSHITVGIADLGRALAFYEKVLAPLKYVLKFHEPDPGWAAWKLPDQDRPLFIITTPVDENPPTVGNGSMTAFLAADHQTVYAVHAAAMALGGKDEGAPGIRPDYHADYYGAYFRDLDGNKLCVVCHDPT
jgi:catechol 2,3-dioxygenase-like lactoylglutathione lyase family enzyme